MQLKRLAKDEKKAEVIIPKINQLIDAVNDLDEMIKFLKKMLPDLMNEVGYLDKLGLKLAKQREENIWNKEVMLQTPSRFY